MLCFGGLMLTVNVDDRVHSMDLAPIAQYAYTPYFLGAAGTEPYKLLAWLAQQIPSGEKIADLGTLHGASAAALAINPEVQVVTYDIKDNRLDSIKKLAQPKIGDGVFEYPFGFNIKFVCGNALDHVDDFADAMLVHLDIDPHDGAQERILLDRLIDHRFRGLLICDDIHLNAGMKRFWSLACGETSYWSDFHAYDLTKWGHWSGTGAIAFDPTFVDIEMKL
jgi:predicted O-methyltransferase YrrM